MFNCNVYMHKYMGNVQYKTRNKKTQEARLIVDVAVDVKTKAQWATTKAES